MEIGEGLTRLGLKKIWREAAQTAKSRYDF